MNLHRRFNAPTYYLLQTQKPFVIIALTFSLLACGGIGGTESTDESTQQITDSDGDQIGDNRDNCPSVVNPHQTDSDQDGTGDRCELVDTDHDGLLDIKTIYQLDMIRNNLEGTALVDNAGNRNSLGCPEVTGCFGYELLADINFDTNNNGELDVEDAFYDSNDNKNDGINEGWDPLGNSVIAFSGVFEGNNHQIINLYSKQYSGFYMGLFGKAENATFRNIRFTGNLSKIRGRAYIGSLVGQAADSNISQVHSDIDVSTYSSKVGGLAGVLTNSTISDSSYTGAIRTEGSYIGGLVGKLENSTVYNSFVTANVTNSDESEDGTMGTIGGLVGAAENSTIEFSYVEGNVQGYNHFAAAPTGGLIAKLENSNVVESYSIGSTSGTDKTGGLIGWISNSTIMLSYSNGDVSGSGFSAGGLVGQAEASIIEDSYALGRVQSTGSYVGGLIGSADSSELNRVFSIGDVLLATPAEDANLYWGGLIGQLSSTNISNCYASGNTRGGHGVGGLTGKLRANRTTEPYTTTITNCYTLGEVSQDNDTSPYGFIYSPSISSNNHFQISDSYWSSNISTASSPFTLLFPKGTYEIDLTDSPLDELLCPESNSDLKCQNGSMYNNWSEEVWDFGTYTEYPGLLIGGEIFRPRYNEETGEYSLFTSS